MKGQGFLGWSDEKMRRMWLGLEIDVVGLPPLIHVCTALFTHRRSPQLLLCLQND